MYFITTKRMLEVCFFQHTPTFIIEPNKTRIKIRKDTQLKNFPLYCPKCKKESLICVNNFKIEIIKEPDA